MSRARIVFLIDQLAGKGTLAGTERHLHQLATGLDREQYEVTVIRFDPKDGTSAEGIRQCGVEVLTVPVGRYYDLQAVRQGRRLADLLRRLRPDVVQTFHYKSDTYGAIVSRMAGVPHVVSSRRDLGWFKKWAQLQVNRVANRCIDRFLVNADAIKWRLAEAEGVEPARVSTIYNGVDLELFRSTDGDLRREARARLGIPDDAFVVGSVAHLRKVKGHRTLFEALERLAPKVPRLWIVLIGEGVLKPELERRAAEIGLADRALFLGSVPDVQSYAPAFDVKVLCSHSEGLSNAILEAMAQGLPVVASRVGGNPELVREGRTGELFTAGDTAALTDRLLRLCTDPALRESQGRQARAVAETEFSLPTMIRRYEGFYDALTGNGSAR